MHFQSKTIFFFQLIADGFDFAVLAPIWSLINSCDITKEFMVRSPGFENFRLTGLLCIAPYTISVYMTTTLHFCSLYTTTIFLHSSATNFDKLRLEVV